MAFPPLPEVAADELERRQLALWKEEDLFHRTLEANREGPPFVFYEGPPTANGRPGIHHVFARTIKDLVCRFHAMQGESVTRIAGWDTHGLPVEIEVEKELKLNGKKAIEAFGVREFNARARRERVQVPGGVGVALRPDRVLAGLRAPLRHLQQRLHRDGLVAAGAAAPARPAVPRAPGAAVLPALRHRALEPRAGAGLRGRHHQLDLRHLPAGRRLRPRAAGVDHHAVDAALQRRGGGAPGPGVRRVRGRRTPAHPGDRARRTAEQLGQGRAELRRARRAAHVLRPRAGRAALPPAARGGAASGGPRLARGGRRATSSPRTTDPAWCTWRPRSARTTTRPGSEHGLALARPVGADGTFTGTTGPRSRAGWSPTRRPTT